MSSFLFRLGQACYRSWKKVVLTWLAIVVVLGGAALAIGATWDNNFTIPGTSGQKALDQLRMTFPQASRATGTILLTVPDGDKVTDPAIRSAVEAYLTDLEKLPFVIEASSPYSEYTTGLISDDQTSALISVAVEGSVSTVTTDQRNELRTAAKAFEQTLPGSQVSVGGEIYAVELPSITIVEAIGVLVALVVLYLTLGSLLGAIMPVGSALMGVALGVFITMLGSGVIAISATALMLAVMLGLAVGMDYSLFILSRHRDQLATGMGPEESAARAVATSGSAVVFAGLTVMIALIGLSVAGLPFITVMGVFAAVTVAGEVALALTLLPALMGMAGERLRPRKSRSEKTPLNERAAGTWVRLATKVPVLTIVLVIAALGALTLPIQHLEMALPNSGRNEPTAEDRITFDRISEKFGIGTNAPLIVTGTIVESTDPLSITDGLRTDIEAMPGVARVALSTPNANADTALVQIIPTTGPDDPATADLVHRLRDRNAEWQQRYGIDTSVTGFTAVQIDVSEKLGTAMIPFTIFVVGLSLVLLMIVFRSIAVPIKAALGFVLSIGSAFGLTALVFNLGWGASIINLTETRPVISFLPIMVTGILFGLAMDYEVFLTSRMREEFIHGNRDNFVRDGFVHSAKVVAAAAAIMTAVFAFFIPHGSGTIKPIAFALTVGVAIDAFLVRMTLGPAVMKMLGSKAWWLPAWLDRLLPSLDVEGEGITRQLALTDWPRPDDDSIVHAEGVAITTRDAELVPTMDLRLRAGDVVVIDGERASRLALLYGLAGRLTFTSGTIKVLGRVLPQEASLVRREVDMIDHTTVHRTRRVAESTTRLLIVDQAERFTGVSRQRLTEVVRRAAADGRAVVLGVEPFTVWTDIAGPDHRLVTLRPVATPTREAVPEGAY